MLLIQKEICNLAKNRSFINPFHFDNAQGASYDMRLGEKCYISSSHSSNDGIVLLEDNKEITIPKNTIFMFQTMEKLTLPLNLVGKLSLRMGLIRQGLIMPSQPQIDAGYDNYVFGMLYNLSNRDIILKRGDHVASVEFYKLPEKVQPYRDHYQNYSLADFVAHHVQSSMNYLDERISDAVNGVESQERFLKFYSYLIGLLTLAVTIMAFLMIFQPYFGVKRAIEENRNHISAVTSEVHKLTAEMTTLGKQMEQNHEALFQPSHDVYLKRLKSLESIVAKQADGIKALKQP